MLAVLEKNVAIVDPTIALSDATRTGNVLLAGSLKVLRMEKIFVVELSMNLLDN